MKKDIYLIVLVVPLIFSGCQDDEVVVETWNAELVQAHSARISGIVQDSPDNGININYPVFYLAKHKNPGPEDIVDKPAIKGQSSHGNFSANPTHYSNLGVLESNTTYYYRLCAEDDRSNDKFCGEVKSFTTPKAQTFTDERDGQEYEYVEIGNQTWMAENLNYASEKSVAFEDEAGHTPYGRAYFYEEHEDICPAGWHVPSDEEWQTLEKRMGMPDSMLNQTGDRGYSTGDKLMQPNELTMNEKEAIILANNESGLSILPFGGYYSLSSQEFSNVYGSIKYMTATKDPKNKLESHKRGRFYTRNFSPYLSHKVNRSYGLMESTASYVRCLKD